MCISPRHEHVDHAARPEGTCRDSPRRGQEQRAKNPWWDGPVLAHAPTRFYGTATLDPTRVGRDAGRIADEMIAHLVGLVGSEVTVTLEIDAMMPTGASPHVVRTRHEPGCGAAAHLPRA